MFLVSWMTESRTGFPRKEDAALGHALAVSLAVLRMYARLVYQEVHEAVIAERVHRRARQSRQLTGR